MITLKKQQRIKKDIGFERRKKNNKRKLKIVKICQKKKKYKEKDGLDTKYHLKLFTMKIITNYDYECLKIIIINDD